MGAIDSASPKTEVIPFARLAPGALDDVLAAQRREWLERLFWDIGEIVEFVGDAIRARALRGAAILVDGTPAGFGFFTIEVDRCLIGELYVAPEFRSPEVNADLIHGIVRLIRQTRPRKRVESQSIVFDSIGADEALTEHGFARHERDYLIADLSEWRSEVDPVHARARVRPWEETDFAVAAEVIYQSYRGSVDARINAQYRTREGCADLLDALTDSPWCGHFDASMARAAVGHETGRMCGVAVASAISERVAHFAQISVLPAFQNVGLGRAMISSAMEAAQRLGFTRATLAVTRENRGAARLYESLGFRPHISFSVFTRDAAPFRSRTR